VKHLLHQGRFWIGAGILSAIVVLLVLAEENKRISNWIEGGSFQDLLNRETSKGLKLEANYAPLTREGLLGLRTDSFTGIKGQKAIVEMDAHEISGWFDPLGIARHRWQINDLHIKWGTVMLQVTQPSGKKSPGMPWWGLFWPYRVHLEDVKVDDATALFMVKAKESGIYHTFLEITPNYHDFEYDARGGQFKTPLTPPLIVRHLHLLIRKPKLTCGEFVLGDDAAHPEEKLRIVGEAGLQEDRTMKFTADLFSLKLAPWLSEKLRSHVSGFANGHFGYISSGGTMETAQLQGHLSLVNVILHELAPVKSYINLTRSPDPGDLNLKTCEMDVNMKNGDLVIENLRAECDKVFDIEGNIKMAQDKTLSGELQVGLTDEYLHWLPTAETVIFTRKEGDYHFATVHVSGTVQKPEQDLSERIIREVEKSPQTGLKLFFHAASSWFDFDSN
jgi:hypothetical protein